MSGAADSLRFQETIVKNNASTSCFSPECIHMAKYMKKRIDTSVNPCDNFYDFACGGYEKHNISKNPFVEITDNINKRLLYILTSVISDKDNQGLQIAKKFYQACIISSERSENLFTNPVKSILNLINVNFGRWPSNTVQMNWEPTADNAKDIFMRLSKIGRSLGFDPNSIINLEILPNIYKPTERILVVSDPLLPFNVNGKRKGTLKQILTYSKLILSVAIFSELQNAGQINIISENRKHEISDSIIKIINFELLISQAKTDFPTKRNYEEYTPISIKSVQSTYPYIQWRKFMEIVLGPGYVLNDNDQIVITSPEYVKNLNLLFQDGDVSVIWNYIIWKYIFFGLKLSIPMQDDPERKQCLAMTLASFDPFLSKKYVELYFSERTRNPLLEMGEILRNIMYNDFESYSWIDEASKKNIKEKVKELVLRIGYNDDMLNVTKYIKLYSKLHVRYDDFFYTALAMSKLIIDFIVSTLNKNIDRNGWPLSVSSLAVNAFYIPTDNSLIIPAALLQPEVYSPSRPAYINYGTVGYIIGHELSHAFDTTGRLFDKHGRKSFDLWTAKTIKSYESKIQCFVHQYNGYFDETTEKLLNGTRTLGENIADNEGILKAYKAYELWMQKHGEEKRLPGLTFSPRQLFWIGTASLWCNKISRKMKKMLKRDSHSPAKYRVIGMVSNSPQFARDFSCPVGSFMNPKQKCNFN